MTLKLNAQIRALASKGARNLLREDNRIPGVVYGHGIENKYISLNYLDLEKLISASGTSNIIDLDIEGEKKSLPVIIADMQHDPENDRVTHIDLHQVRMDEKITTDVALKFINESPAVKELGANLIISKDTLKIECLPKDLISQIEIDLSGLAAVDQSIHIRDIKVPTGVVILDDEADSVVSVLAPREEKVEEAAAAMPEMVEAEKAPAAEGDVAAPAQK